MLNNKKGYLKILEAIIALIVVFSFLVVMIPRSKIKEDTSKMPLELKTTIDAVIKVLHENNERRVNILLTAVDNAVDNNNNNIKTAVTDTLNEILPIFAQWDYAFSVKCMLTEIESEPPCDENDYYYFNSHPFDPDETEELIGDDQDDNFMKTLPIDRNIYAKTLFVTVKDVTEQEEDVVAGEFYKQLTIYFWEKT